MEKTIEIKTQHRGIDNAYFITIFEHGKPMYEAKLTEVEIYNMWKNLSSWEFDEDEMEEKIKNEVDEDG